MSSEDPQVHARRIGAALGPMFDGARVPIIALRPDGRFVAANEVALSLYGYSLEELLALRIHDLIVNPHDVERDLRLVAQGALELGRRRHRRKDGTLLWVLPAPSLMDLCGERYFVSVQQDITAVVEAEARAKKDEQRAEALWQAASERLTDGIALLDRDFRIVKVNSALCSLLGRRDDDLVGRRCSDVFPSCRQTPCSHEIAAADERPSVREFQGRVSGRPLRIEIIPCSRGSKDGDGDPHFAFIHTAHDQTEERAYRSELISADRLATIGRLAAGVAHEVNNPAAFVTVNLGVLRDRLAAGTTRAAEAIMMLDESLEGMRRIHDMVRDLKGFARERPKERVNLGELAASAVRMAAHATRGHAKVHKNLERDVHAAVRGARIAQVVLNLLINAAQAIPSGHQSEHRIGVRIWKDRERGLACIEVSDSGPGVPPELAGRIFEPFFTTREKTGGTGLGLWLAREIVEEEGGRIVLCDSPGRGATFLLTLALAPPEPASVVDTPSRPSLPA